MTENAPDYDAKVEEIDLSDVDIHEDAPEIELSPSRQGDPQFQDNQDDEAFVPRDETQEDLNA